MFIEMKGVNNRMIALWFWFLCCFQPALSQGVSDPDYFLKALRINSGFTYFPNSEDEFHRHREITWSNQLSVSITRGLYAGVQINSIYTWGTHVPKENFFLKGAFLQYDFLMKEKALGFLELNYLQGDYCTCAPEDPFRKFGLHYIGFGPGLDYPILSSNFYGSASFIFHRILGDIQGKYGYNILKVGLSYRFGKPKL